MNKVITHVNRIFLHSYEEKNPARTRRTQKQQLVRQGIYYKSIHAKEKKKQKKKIQVSTSEIK